MPPRVRREASAEQEAVWQDSRVAVYILKRFIYGYLPAEQTMSWLTDEQQKALLDETGGTTIRKMIACIEVALNARGLTTENIERIFKRASKLDARPRKIAEAEMRAKAAYSATFKANVQDMDD